MNRSTAIIGFLLATTVTLFVLQWDAASMRILLWTIVLVSAVAGGTTLLLFKKETGGWTSVAIGIGIALAVFRIDSLTQKIDVSHIAELPDGMKIELLGWVREAPEFRPTSTRYVLQVDAIRTGESEKKIRGNILVTDRATWPEYGIGQYVGIQGTASIPQAFQDFDYQKYLSAKGIDRVMDRAQIETARSEKLMPSYIQYSPSRILHPVRRWFEHRITRILPEPHASLLIGLLTGGRTGLPQELSEAFRIAGLSHIVAISGYNITIILTLFSALLFFLPVKKRFWPLSIGITIFVLFVGAGAPVFRAGIMGILGLLAIQADRRARPRLLILWTLFFMSLWNPKALWYDPGFQLSFLATMGIAELGPYLKKKLALVPETLGIRESLATTLAAQIATLPVTMLLFQQLSIVAPFSNLLVAPLIPLTMLTGFLGTMLGAIYEPLGLLVGAMSWALLEIIVRIVHVSASVPYAALQW